jgi:hypothetical protein
MAIDKIAKIAKKYECIKCNYITSNKYDYDKHLLTAKHYRLTNTNENSRKIAKVHICDCGKEYKHASSLSGHKKKCTYTTEEEPKNTIMPHEENNIDFKAMFIEAMKDNRELRQTVKEMVPLIGNNNTITNNTTNNNTFNVMLYLNDHCKDAISIEQFMNDIVVTDQDIVSMSKHNKPADNFAKLIMKSLKGFDVTKRPLHCTDQHRGTLYIKHDEGWTNDQNKERDEVEIKETEKWKKTDTKDPIIPNAMKKTISLKSWYAINSYKQSHPNSCVEDTAEYIMTRKAEQNTYCDCTDTEELDTITHKITKQLCPTVRLDKNATA